MGRSQQNDDQSSNSTGLNYTNTAPTNSTTNTTIQLIDNDIHVKSNNFNLLKLKFENQQLGKKLWLERRELKHYEFIPIEFSKDAYFVSNFIKRMNQNKQKFPYFRYDWYGHDYFNILSDELKMEIDIVSNAEIEHSFDYSYSTPDTSLIDRIYRICSQSETKCIEIVCQIAKVVIDIDTFIRKYNSVFPFIEKLLNDEEFLLKCISSSYKVFKFVKDKVNEQQQNGPYDLQFILKCLNINSKVLRYINKPSSIFNDKQLIMKLFQSITMKRRGKYEKTIFNKLSQPLKNDREVVLLAVEKGFPVLDSISSTELVNDREIVLQSVRNDGSGLIFVCGNLKNDREIVAEAIRHNSDAFQFASPDLKYDREFVSEMVTKFKARLSFASQSLKDDRDLILASIKNHPDSLWSMETELGVDREFTLECVKINGLSLHYAPDFHSDIEVVNEAIKQNPFSIYRVIDSVGPDYKNSFLNAVELIQLKDAASPFVYSQVLKLINDLDMVMKLIEINPLSIHFLGDTFRTNYPELTYKSTLLHNGYWMKHSEDAYQERINHAYYSAKIDSNGGGGDQEINYYRNVNKTNLWKDLKWKKWECY